MSQSVQNFEHEKKAVLYTGTSGTGKTTEWQKRIQAEKARIKFIYDHEGEYAVRFKQPAVTDKAELVRKTALGGYVVFDPVDFDGDLQEGFEFFTEFVFTVKENLKGRVLFCCDEIQFFVDSYNKPEALLNILERGRRREIDCHFIGQAPNCLHGKVRNQISEVVTFRQSDKNAIAWMEDQGLDPEKIRTLKNGQWLSKNLRTGEFQSGGKAF